MKLSIIIPVFNEEKTVAQLLEKVAKVSFSNIVVEIIVVDDGSSDSSVSKIKKHIEKHKQLKFIAHKNNQGKGAAILSGIRKATGDYIIIQDADLEYNPQEITKLVKPVIEKKAQVVYGTRLKRLPNLKRDERTPQFFIHYIGNKFLSLLTSIIYFQWITDMETCYKLFPREVATTLQLKARGFEFEPEITAKLLKRGYTIFEVPISTNPRSYDEGKKINTVKDGIKACWYLLKYRFVD